MSIALTVVPDNQPDLSDPDMVRKIANEGPGTNGARNLRITRSYFEIGRRLRQRLGDGNADWATTAAWASGAVGLIVRAEEANTSRVIRIIRRLAGDRYESALGGVRANLEEGNRQVYSELGVAFAELAELGSRDSWTAGEENEFLASLPSARRSVPVEWQDEVNLVPAFRLYLQAMRVHGVTPEERKLKAELIFAANVKATLSEQAGLQPYLDAAFQPAARYVSAKAGPLARMPLVRGAVQMLGYSAQALTQRVVTEYGIKVVVADEALSVGDSFRPRRGRLWSPDLAELRQPDAQQVYEQYNLAQPNGRGSSAADWTVLTDRMNYIVNFFRAWQQDPVFSTMPTCVR